ncbi:preprotein translocase subunit SecG [Pelagibaculum spongiae]|uniref:Protein-export membrane protein SecG n=1 Tax=Pelagibaculum spongiae TaxID=2080658 RepID=A0A2V1GX78_9GAMM|nr:preprotein translocase subunit SecG [Pelagibaculum spongiae]PVZ71781.1 preprotein translocase subunit SecG [Pelagibaculum spongiae]
MHTLFIVIHVLAAAGVIGFVLLQQGKGAEAGAGFGGGASGTVFGASGSGNFLTRSTAILAAIFFVTSLTLGYFATGKQAPVSIFGGDQPAAVEQQVEIPVVETPINDSDVPVVESIEAEKAE